MPKWRKAAFLKAAADVTTSYGGWDSSWVDVGEATQAVAQFTYSDTDATTIELKVQTEEDAATDGFDSYKVSAGVAEVDELAITVSGMSTSFNLKIDTTSFPRFRVRAKQTGGSATGNTLAVEFLAGGL